MAETAVAKKAALLPAPVVSTMRDLMPDVYKLLPPDITSEQFRAACWLELTSNTDVPDCVVESIRDAIIAAANAGLMPGRDCHFLAYKQKRYRGQKGLQSIPNYFGILRTLDRTGKVRRAFAHPVHEGDEWEFDVFSERPVHRQAVTLGKHPGKELFYYGAILKTDGTCHIEIVTLDDLDAVRRRAPGHDNGPWVTDRVMMCRKTCIKRVAKYVQLTPALRGLLEADEEREKEDIPAARHQQNVIDLFGPGSDPTAPAPPPPSASEPPTPDNPLITRIEDALKRQGYSYDERDAWWEQAAARMPDLYEPLSLTVLYEELQATETAVAAYLPRIEATILAQPGGDIERWMVWAERRFRKARAAFSVEDYQDFLAAVQHAAQRRLTDMPQEATQQPQEGHQASAQGVQELEPPLEAASGQEHGFADPRASPLPVGTRQEGPSQPRGGTRTPRRDQDDAASPPQGTGPLQGPPPPDLSGPDLFKEEEGVS